MVLLGRFRRLGAVGGDYISHFAECEDERNNSMPQWQPIPRQCRAVILMIRRPSSAKFCRYRAAGGECDSRLSWLTPEADSQ